MKVIVYIDIFVKVLIMLMATQKRPKKAKKKVIKMKYIRIKIRQTFSTIFHGGADYADSDSTKESKKCIILYVILKEKLNTLC